MIVYSNPYLLALHIDRKSTRLNSSHLVISYAVFCLKKREELLSDGISRRAVRVASKPLPVRPRLFYFCVPRESSASRVLFFFNETATPEIYTLSLHDALPISLALNGFVAVVLADAFFRQHPAAAKSDRKSTRLNSSHLVILYAVFCLKKDFDEVTNVSVAPAMDAACIAIAFMAHA